MKKDLIVKKKNKLLELSSNLNIDNVFYELKGHKHDDEVYCFGSGNNIDKNGMEGILLPLNSAIKNNKKIHIFFSNEELKIFSLVKTYLDKNFEKGKKTVILTILKVEEFIDFESIKRARKGGSENIFPNFNFGFGENSPYSFSRIMHNDTAFISKKELSKNVGIVTKVQRLSYGNGPGEDYKNEINNFVSDFFNINFLEMKEYYYFHTGYVCLENDVAKEFSKFIKKNYAIIKENYKIFKFPEQDLLSIFASIYNIPILQNCHEEGNLRGENTSHIKFLHFDNELRGTFYLEKDLTLNGKIEINIKTLDKKYLRLAKKEMKILGKNISKTLKGLS